MGLTASVDHNQRYLAPPDLRQDLTRRTAKGGMIGMIAQACRLVIQIGGTAVLSRLLSPSDFGLVALATTVTVFVAMFTDLGLSGATVQRHEIDQPLVSTLFAINLGVGVALWLIACLLAPLAAWFYGDPPLVWLVIGLAAAIPMSAAGAQHNALLIRTMQWVKIQTIAVGSQFIGLAAAIALLLTTDIGYWALVVQQVGAALTSLILAWTLCRWRPSLPLDFAAAKSGVAFGGYVTGNNVINYFNRQGDNLLLGWRWGNAELGYYSRAYNLLTLPITIVQSTMSSIAVPALSRVQHDEATWNSAFLRLICIANFAGIGLCAIIFACAEPLILFLLGRQWGPVVPIFQLLAISSVMATSVNGLSWIFISKGLGRDLFRWTLGATPLIFLSFVVGLPWGGRGVAGCYAVMMSCVAMGFLIYAIRRTTIALGQILRLFLPIYLLAVAAALAGHGAATELSGEPLILALFVSAGVAATVYAAGALVMIISFAQYRELRDSLDHILRSMLRRA